MCLQIKTINTLDDPAAFFKKHKGKSISAIVEHVRDGSSARVRLLLPNNTHQMTWVFFSGIKVPSHRDDAAQGNHTLAPDTFVEEAKSFVEARILQRDVSVYPEGVNGNALLASVIHPVGNIAEFLLKEGLAKILDWSLSSVTKGAEALKAAEKYAKDRKLNLWKHHETPLDSKAGFPEPQFQGTVLRILAPDSLLIRSKVTKQEYKISLSSLRPPRKDTQEPYVIQAKEFLRSKCIGQHVNVHVDYLKPPQNEFEEKICAQVYLKNQSISEDLVRNGLATVTRHRREDDDRASQYDGLITAEREAIDAKRGVHSGQPGILPKINDVSATVAKAKQFLPFLQRQSSASAIVEHVVNGSRLRLYSPKESARFNFVLNGIRVPKQGEPLSSQALQKTSDLVYQREIQVQVENVDKTAAFVGTVLIHGQNLAVALLRAGLATVHDYSAQNSCHSSDLYQAERDAKSKKLGVWRNYDEAAEAAAAMEQLEISSDSGIKKQLAEVIISEYKSPNHFYIQTTTHAAVEQLETLMQQFSSYHATNPNDTAEFKPKPNDLVSAKFSVDQQWYRARVKKISPKECIVFYIDYGNSETLPITSLRPLPEEFSKLPGQAQEARLSYLKDLQSEDDSVEDALNYFHALTVDKKLIANIDRFNPLSITLFDRATAQRSVTSPIGLALDTSINVKLLSQGYSLLDKRQVRRLPSEFSKILELAQEEARSNHCGIWKYGDIDDDD
ncbi:hypothetical protein HMI56_001546 [Coelomomyces lativittatus]|nr:hypothetical protein HMI56_001546 [Coelomomyces lativittatus]